VKTKKRCWDSKYTRFNRSQNNYANKNRPKQQDS